MGDDVLSGLSAAHAAGVVHRDLKPSNIFLCEPGPKGGPSRSKVLDFGVCKLDVPTDDEKLTTTGESVGTASYMAPEQIRGASAVNERADLYSFGTVIFEALSGQLPHFALGQMAMLASKLEQDAMRLSDAAQVPVPAGLEALLSDLLARDAKKRPVSAAEVRAAWRGLGEPVVQPRASALDLQAAGAPPLTETSLTSGTVAVDTPTSRVGIALAAFSLTASAVVLIAMLVARRSDSGARPQAVDDFTSAAAPTATSVEVAADPAPSDASAAPVQPAASATPPDPVPAAEAPVVDETPPAAIDAAPSVPPKTHPPHRWQGTRPPSPKQPHIADKPRY
jgi:eukaryotic-like serine/threonine-protein kinase